MSRRHCSDEELLKRLDGELGMWETFRVSRHLARCWRCRAALADLDSHIHAVSRIMQQDAFPRELIDAARERFFRSAAQLQIRFRDAAPARFRLQAWPARAAAGLVLSLSAFACWHYVHGLRAAAVPPAPAPPKKVVVTAAPAVRPVPLPPPPIRAVPRHHPEPLEAGPGLDAVEMRALYTLHQLGACLGEEIDIARSGEHELLVSGVVASGARKRELADALAAPAFSGAVRLELRSLDEVAAPGLPPESGAGSAEAAPSEIPIEAALLEYFHNEDPGRGDGENRRRAVEVSNDALRLANLAFSHAWALRHFAARYPRERFELLRPEEAAMAHDMIRDHLSGLASASAELNKLTGAPLRAAAGSEPGEALPASDAHSWQSAADVLFRATERLFVLSNDLFACGDTPLADLPARAAGLKSILDGMAVAVSSASAAVPSAKPVQALFADGVRQ